MPNGGDCRASAPVAKPNEAEARCRVRWFSAEKFHANLGRCAEEQRTLQSPQSVVALTDEGNLNVDVANKTPLSGRRRIDR